MMATVTPHSFSTSCFLPASGDFFDPVHESTSSAASNIPYLANP